jgi:hypothetical protein
MVYTLFLWALYMVFAYCFIPVHLISIQSAIPYRFHTAISPVYLSLIFLIQYTMSILKTVIYPADIKLVEGCSTRTANRRYNLCKDALGKSKMQKIAVAEYAKWIGIDLDVIKTTLKII